jgi:transcriptional regulator with XRE-family HTH domain
VIDRDLGAFIRSRREAITPAEVGLPAGSRRRTPGLRRSELATIAGISVEYLTRIEQGRDRNPSSQVLGALADALRLDEDALEHLRILSLSAHSELCPAAIPPARSIRPAVQAILDRLGAAPALVLNDLTDVLAWTPTYERIARPVGLLDAAPPNLIRYTFLDPRARTTFPQWDRVAEEQVANLRASGPPDEQAQRFLDELRAEPAFAERWARRGVARKQSGTKVITHPEVGELRLGFETLVLPDADAQRLVVYLPADDATGQALDRLEGRGPGLLHAVPDPAGA